MGKDQGKGAHTRRKFFESNNSRRKKKNNILFINMSPNHALEIRHQSVQIFEEFLFKTHTKYTCPRKMTFKEVGKGGG